MGDQDDFQRRVQKIGELLRDLETIADPAAQASAKELVQLLMDMHGMGLERMLEIVFESGDGGARVIDELGEDPVVRGLLVLYGLHPDEIETRVQQKLKQIDPKLNKMGAEAKLVGVDEGVIRVRVSVEGHGCGSTKQTARTLVEEAIYEAAPDLTSLIVEGLEEAPASGFVALGQLSGTALPAVDLAGRTSAQNSDGMD